MKTDVRLQPKFKVLINDVDVTKDILEVSVDQKENLLTSADIKMAKGLIYLDSIKINDKVTVYGGTFDDRNYGLMFIGNILYIRPEFASNGVVSVRYTCFSSNSGLKKDIDRVLFYPSTNSPRSWANVSSLKVSTIIEKITSEMGMTFGKFNNKKALVLPDDAEITHKTRIKQNMPDWGFLRVLAKKFGCKMWEDIDPEDGRYKFYFVDADKVFGDIAQELTFVYVPRDANLNLAMPKLTTGQIQLLSFSCNEDSTSRTRNLRTVSMFDAQGNAQEVNLEFDEKNDQLFYYKLNQERLNSLSIEEQNNLMRLISNRNFLESGVDFYYDKVEITKEQQGSVDWFTVSGRPDMGVEASITFSGDISVKPYRYYRILGVSNRYSSNGSEGTWYMKDIKHKFTSTTGYTCTAKLYR